jgi:hypothetical protein
MQCRLVAAVWELVVDTATLVAIREGKHLHAVPLGLDAMTGQHAENPRSLRQVIKLT